MSKAEDIYLDALAMTGQSREAFLESECAGDEDLRSEVDELLSASNHAETYFSGLMARVLDSEESEPAPGTTNIGAYRVIKMLGRGGMGAVYLGERIDGEFEKQVAIKVLPEAAATKSARERFLTERQLLAELVHPHICRLLDGGVTDEGLPYFVMDYVEGERLDRYCDSNRLGVPARLGIFQQVCSAVRYAHRNLILHRDIKPGNILVDNNGNAQLLDFGVGKALPPGYDASSAEATRLPLTPSHASPEIIMGLAADTASDVYSLGVVLYQLVSGAHPYELDGLPMASALKLMSESEPKLASRRFALLKECEAIASSRRTSTTQLEQTLRGDLDNILARCLHNSPDDRYPSAEALAEDIQRFLDNKPVSARPPTRRYLATKFVQRYKLPVALASLTALALVALTIMALKYVLETSEQARLIAAQRDRAQSISDFFIGVFEEANPIRQDEGGELSARELVDQAVVRVDQTEGLSADTEADLLRAASNMYASLDLLNEAISLGEREIQLREVATGRISDEVANALEHLSQVEDANGGWQAAEDYAMQALQIRQQLSDQLGLAASYNQLGRMRHLQGDLTAAGENYRKALDIHLTFSGDNEEAKAQTISHLASLALHQGRLQEAERMHRTALAIRSDIYGDNHLVLLESRLGLSQSLLQQERYEEARGHLLNALATNNEFIGPDSRNNAFLFGTLGEVERGMGNFDAAQAYYESSMRIWSGVSAEHPNLGIVASFLGQLQVETGAYTEAITTLERSRSILIQSAPKHWRLLQANSNLAAALMETGRHEQAETLLVETYPALLERFGIDDERAQTALARLVRLYDLTDRPELAAAYR